MSKESLYSVDSRVILRVPFNSFDDIVKRGGTPTDITLSNGVGLFNGSTSSLSFICKTGTVSIRFKFKSITPVSGRYLCDNNANNMWVYFTTNSTIQSLFGTIFVNGVLTSTVSTSTKEIVISGISRDSRYNLLWIMSSYSGLNKGTAELELVEVYNGTLTATEVSELYKGTLYKAPNLDANTVLDIDPNRGNFEDKKGHIVTNTSVSLVRNGRSLVGNYNGSSSVLTVTDADDLSFGDGAGNDRPFSFECWVKLTNKIGDGCLISKGVGATFEYSVYYYVAGSSLTFYIANTSSKYIARYFTYTPYLNRFHHLIVTYDASKAVGGLKIYLDAIRVDTTSDTAGSYTGMSNYASGVTIGKVSSAVLYGLKGYDKLYSKELSLSEITCLYNSQKGLYV